MSEQGIKLGEPIEVPWWVIVFAVPPLIVCVLCIVLAAPWWGRVLGIGSSIAMVAVLRRITSRVESHNMQSVWVSLALAVYFVCVVAWGVSVASNGH